MKWIIAVAFVLVMASLSNAEYRNLTGFGIEKGDARAEVIAKRGTPDIIGENSWWKCSNPSTPNQYGDCPPQLEELTWQASDASEGVRVSILNNKVYRVEDWINGFDPQTESERSCRGRQGRGHGRGHGKGRGGHNRR